MKPVDTKVRRQRDGGATGRDGEAILGGDAAGTGEAGGPPFTRRRKSAFPGKGASSNATSSIGAPDGSQAGPHGHTKGTSARTGASSSMRCASRTR